MPKLRKTFRKAPSRPKKKLHDSTYKLLFSTPVAFADFLRSFVPVASLLNLDYTTLEPVFGSYTTSHLSERRGDIVWRLKTKDGSWHYVYVITELQSKSDWWIRIAEYVAELRMMLIRANIVKGNELFPPILPIVIYRDFSRWTAPKTLNDIQIGLPEPLAVSDTKEEYVLVDIHRLAQESLEAETTVQSCVQYCRKPVNTSKAHTMKRSSVSCCNGANLWLCRAMSLTKKPRLMS